MVKVNAVEGDTGEDVKRIAIDLLCLSQRAGQRNSTPEEKRMVKELSFGNLPRQHVSPSQSFLEDSIDGNNKSRKFTRNAMSITGNISLLLM